MSKKIGVCGIITSTGKHSLHLLLGRRGKDPNRGLFVLPGGGQEDGESLEEAFCREIMEETGLEVLENSKRWESPFVIELPHRIILVAKATVKCREDYDDAPRDGSDLYDVQWFGFRSLPEDVSPVVAPALADWGFYPGQRI